MRRYSLTLQEHIAIADEHAHQLVSELLRLSQVAAKKQAKLKDKLDLTPELQRIYTKLYKITQELKPVEAWVKSNWPDLVDLYDILASLKAEECDEQKAQ